MKRLYLIILVLLSISSIWGREISYNQAKVIADSFLKGQCEKVDLSKSEVAQIKAMSRCTTPEFYIFNRLDNGGYVIVSGEDATPAILGFSPVGHIAADSIPDNLASHLDYFRQQIAYARRAGIAKQSTAEGPTSKTGMRLLTPSWRQFEQMTPGHVPAGCVPTAMAIIMGAWHWPITGEGTSTNTGTINGLGTPYEIALDHNVAFNLDQLPFDVSNFSDLHPDVQYGLANLVLHTGTAIEVQYGTNASGGSSAYTNRVGEVLADHFKFSKDIPKVIYDQSMSVISQRLRDELAAGRPVIYSARTSEDNGHAFICDGVWDDYFHFNLGWGGYSNGYYLLNAINTGNGDYINKAYIVTGIHPRTDDPDYTPRTIPVVYDKLPDQHEDPVTTSPDYSPIEFSSEFGYGLVSPHASYKKGVSYSIYFSGLKLTGRFDDSADWVTSLTNNYVNARLGFAIEDANGSKLDFFEMPYEYSISRENSTISVSSFKIKPNIDVKPEYRIRMYSKIDGQGDWKLIKGLPDVSSELPCSAPSSPYLPYNLSYDSKSFSISNVVGQVLGKVVLGQIYYLYVSPKTPMESIEVTNHGEPIEFWQTTIDNTPYYYFYVTVESPEGLDLKIVPLDKSQTDVTVHLDSPGTLENRLKDKTTGIRNLTITGDINIFDLRYLNTPTFKLIKKLDLSGARITEYSPIYPANYINDYFFYNHELTEVILPSELKDLGPYAFSFCFNMSKLTIPATLGSFSEYCFVNNPFSEVINKCPVPQEITESFVRNLAENSILYVPIGSKTEYESHPYWSRFSQIIEKDFAGVEIPTADEPYTIIRTGNSLTINGAPDNLPVRIYAISGQLLWSGIAAEISKVSNLPNSPIIVVTPNLTLKVR